MIDLKYHIASLVAIFLALAVGILIGTSLMRSPSVEKQLGLLKTRFDKIVAEDKRLEDENTALQQHARLLENALRQVVPVTVRDRIAGRRVAIMACGPEPDASLVREIKFLLATAGATLRSKTTLGGNILPENPVSRAALIEQTAADPLDAARAQRQIAAYLVRQIAAGRDAAVRVVGRYSPGVALDGDYAQPVDAVVLLAGPATDEEAAALGAGTSVQARIADTLRELAVTTVVCERQDCPVTLMPHFARYNLTTVDGIDTALGRIALVYALAGKQGHYGTKSSANQVLPDLDIEPVRTTAPSSGGRARLPAHSLPPAPPAPVQQPG